MKQKKAKVLIIRFADLVKYYASQYYNWNGEKDEYGRGLLQYIGTDMMRTYDPNYWALIIAKFLDAAKNDFDIAIIPDWRFINEYEKMCEYNTNVIAIRVDRYNTDGSQYINPTMTEKQLNHISENQLDNFAFDYIIENRGTLEELDSSVEMVINCLEEK